MVTEIEPNALQALIKQPDPPYVLDVREPWEIEIASLPFAAAVPMDDVPDRLQELPRDRPIVVMCRSGARSLQVARFLERNGFDRVANLTGGILAWREQIDPTMTPY